MKWGSNCKPASSKAVGNIHNLPPLPGETWLDGDRETPCMASRGKTQLMPGGTGTKKPHSSVKGCLVRVTGWIGTAMARSSLLTPWWRLSEGVTPSQYPLVFSGTGTRVPNTWTESRSGSKTLLQQGEDPSPWLRTTMTHPHSANRKLHF